MVRFDVSGGGKNGGQKQEGTWSLVSAGCVLVAVVVSVASAWSSGGSSVPALAQPVVVVGFEEELGVEHVVLRCTATRVKEHATEGVYALRTAFLSGGEKRLNGFVLEDLKVKDWAPYASFDFDMFNPNDFPITMHVRIDLEGGGTAWDNAVAQPRVITHSSVAIKADWSSPKVATVLLYNYSVELPSACSLFFDNFHLSVPGYLAGLRSVKLVDSYVENPPSAEEVDRGVRLFHRNALDIVYGDSKPRPEDEVGELRAFGTPGEPESVTLAVRALRDLSECRVSVTDLSGPGGKIIPANAVEVGTVRALRKMWALHGVPFYYESIPAFIQARPAVAIRKDTTQTFWLKVRVPRDLAAGLYRGAIRVETDGGHLATVPLRFEVLPFALDPVPRGKAFGLYYTNPWQKDRRAQYDRDFRDMRDHGMTGVGLCVGPPKKDYGYVAGAVQLGWDGSSDFEMAVDAYKRNGFPEPLLCLSMGPVIEFAGRFGDVDSAAYQKAFLDFMKAMDDWGKAHQWPEIVWQPVDEPNWQGDEARHKAIRLLHILKAGGFRTEMDGRLDEWGMKALVGDADVDVLTEQYFNLQQEVIEGIHRAGQKVQLYNWDETGFQPERMRQVPGLVAWKVGLDGTYTWAYQTLGGRSQFNDLDGGIDDSFYYSAAEDEVGGPSTGWEAYREGVKDYRYLQTLDRSLRKLEASTSPSDRRLATPLRSELEGILRDVKVWRDKGYCGGFSASWSRDYTDSTGQRFCEGPPPTFSGWPLDRFDDVRWRLALMIMKARGLSVEGVR